jgi:hypothetical protein
MLCRSAGSILSADANCLADADEEKTPKLHAIGRYFRQIDNWTQGKSRSQATPDDKVAEKIKDDIDNGRTTLQNAIEKIKDCIMDDCNVVVETNETNFGLGTWPLGRARSAC